MAYHQQWREHRDATFSTPYFQIQMFFWNGQHKRLKLWPYLKINVKVSKLDVRSHFHLSVFLATLGKYISQHHYSQVWEDLICTLLFIASY